MQEIGYELDVSSQYMVEYESMPTYVVTADPMDRKRLRVQFNSRTEEDIKENEVLRNDVNMLVKPDDLLIQQWGEWQCKKIMLSRYGLFQVTLEHRFTEQSLTDLLWSLAGLEQEFDLDALLNEQMQAGKYGQLRRKPNVLLEPSVQWEITRILIDQFLEKLEWQLVVYRDDRKPTTIKFDRDPKRRRAAFTSGLSYPHRFRYAIFEFEKLYQVRDGTNVLISPEQLTEADRVELTSHLEGLPVIANANSSGTMQQELSSTLSQTNGPVNRPLMFPSPAKVSWSNRLFGTDISSWEKESAFLPGITRLSTMASLTS